MAYEWRPDADATMPPPGAVLLTSFPTAGLAATVAGYYILRSLRLPRIGVVDSPDSVPIAIIHGGQVNPAIRVYGGGDIAMVLTEFPPHPAALNSVTQAILDGAERIGARLVLGIEGVVPHPMRPELEDGGKENDGEPLPEEKVWVVTSKPDHALREGFRRAQVDALTDGVLGGVSGALLVKGQRQSVPVAVLLVSARETDGFPDHRAAATLIEALDRYLPALKIDTAPLRSQAERIERAVRAAMRQSRPPNPSVGPGDRGDTSTIYQ
jgi:predicted ATP-grasp superfamily ATP-dependent carboligase